MSFEVIDGSAFVRQWVVQGARIGWLLGAGASAAAQVPTADHITMDLLLRMYADAHQLVRQRLSLAEAADVDRIRAYYDNKNGMPLLRDPSAYSAAFQLALPDEEARRQYLRSLFEGRSPSFGQRILGALVASGLCNLLITTNFDDLVEKAVEQAQVRLGDPSRNRLGVAALGNPTQAGLALSDNDFPYLFKLHGDFRERHLKNLVSELQTQDVRMRQAVLDASRRFGMAVVGYSGRDASVMEMLKEAVATDGAFPAGLWWLGRDLNAVLEPVSELFNICASRDVAAHFVKIETFDEILGALGRHAMLPDGLRAYVDNLKAEPRARDSALPEHDRGALPVLRMNALPVIEAPTRALLGKLRTVPEGSDLRKTLASANWRGAIALSGRQALALGSGELLSSTLEFEGTITTCDINPTAPDAPTVERALVYEAITRGVARRLPARPLIRDSGHRLIVTPRNPDRPDTPSQAQSRQRLEDAYKEPLTGLCPLKLGRGPDGQARQFAEAVELSLEWRFGVLWVLFVPKTWVTRLATSSSTRGAQGDPASAWRKERWVSRRNEKWAAIIDAWARSIAPENRTEIPVLSEHASGGNIVGGRFVLSQTTAYSREAQ